MVMASWCSTVRQDYNVAISAHCHKSVPVPPIGFVPHLWSTASYLTTPLLVVVMPPMSQFCDPYPSLSVCKQLYSGTNSLYIHTHASGATLWPACKQGSMDWLLKVYILATSKVISGWLPTCDSTHSWWLYNYSAAPLRNQPTSTMSRYPTQPYYPDTEPASPCPILLMPSNWLWSNKYQFYKLLLWLNWDSNSRSPTHEAGSDLCACLIIIKAQWH